MKKIILLSTFSLIIAAVFTSCIKNVHVNDNENYWLTKERGAVVFSEAYCGYYVVETAYGYSVVASVSGSMPYEDDLLYGEFGYNGTRDFYNRSSGRVITGQVVEYDLTYNEAQLALDYYCPVAGKTAVGASQRTIKNSGTTKIARVK